MESMWENVKADVLKAAKLLYARQLVNAYEGNVSARAGDSLFITPSQVCKEELEADDLVEVDIPSGETVWARPGRRASSECKMHLCCYRARPDIRGVAHAHPPYATAFAIRRRPIETMGYPEMMLLFGRVPVCRYGRPSTEAVCDEIPAVLVDYEAFLLANHGLCTVGASAMEAAYRLESIESIARVLTIARQDGGEWALPEAEGLEIEQMRRNNRKIVGRNPHA
ncbi:MAG: class II aldolase/adducin family protein [Clostridia bacterium]|nr:class II aldolase/adducin family protein [Clostridia bacterium]